MALDAVVFPQDSFTTSKDLYSLLGGNWSYDDENDQDHHDQQQASLEFLGYQTDQNYPSYGTNYFSPPSMVPHFNELHLSNPNPDASTTTPPDDQPEFQLPLDNTVSITSNMPSSSTRVKRRRAKSKKNKEEIENQRMTHIAVERNRRKQMNEYLSELRALMPDSYVQRVH